MVITRKIYQQSKREVQIFVTATFPKRLASLKKLSDKKSIRHQHLTRMFSYVCVVGRRMKQRKMPVLKCFFGRDQLLVGADKNSLMTINKWQDGSKRGRKGYGR